MIIVGGLALCLAGTVDEKFQLVFDLVSIVNKSQASNAIII